MDDFDFKYDPEGEEKSKGTRLPYGLCKAHGIQIQDWWSPKDAWEALRNRGIVKDVSDEYKEYYRNLKKERDKIARKKRAEYNKRRAAQLADPNHNPDKNYVHKDGSISSAQKSAPMNFEQADNGNCNPYYKKGIGYQTNCATCVAVYVARRQGYNVRALPNLYNRNIYELSLDTSKAYIKDDGKHPYHIARPHGQNNIAFLNSTVKEGAICSLEFGWKGSRDGHIVVVEKKDGKLTMYDPQSNQKYTTINEISNYLKSTKGQSIMDLTNCKMDEDFCDKIMKRR